MQNPISILAQYLPKVLQKALSKASYIVSLALGFSAITGLFSLPLQAQTSKTNLNHLLFTCNVSSIYQLEIWQNKQNTDQITLLERHFLSSTRGQIDLNKVELLKTANTVQIKKDLGANGSVLILMEKDLSKLNTKKYLGKIKIDLVNSPNPQMNTHGQTKVYSCQSVEEVKAI